MSKRSWRPSRRTPGAPRPRYVLIVLALCALAGSLVGGGARAASAAGTTPHFVRTCAAVPKGEMRCFALRRTSGVVAHVAAGTNPAVAVSGYGPSDLDSAYNVPTTQGSGKTVAIVDAYDDPNAASDLSTYRSNFGLPACTTANGCFKKVNQNGAASPLPAGNTGWASEIMLDLEMVSAICPNCHILLVEANSPTTSNLGTAVNTAVAQGAVAVSNSYGGSESSSETSADNSYYKHAGVAIVASSGDSGYGVEYPAASPYVTAVGGTSLTRASNARGWTESVWSTSPSEGAGSGCSAFEAKPSFQTDTGCARRTVADVSADADPATGVAVYDSYGSGGWTVFGGTSVASPIIGAMYALAASPAPTAFPNSYPYGDPGALYDVTTGHTASCSPAYLCTAEVGYDGPSGLGTPNGAAAFGPASTGSNDFSVSVNPTNVSVAAGSNATATVSTAVTSGSSESVALSASGLPSGVTASFSPSTVNSGSSSTLTFTASAGATAGNSSVTITGTGSTGSHTATLTLSVTAGAANDFSLSVSPTSASVAAGSGTTATVSTAVTSGSAQTVSLSASGLPSGASASFSPSSVTAGSASTLTISTSSSTPAGTYPVTITGTGASATHATSFALTVTAASACTAAQEITNPGFESGSTGWSATAGVIGQNGPQEPAHSGTWDAWLDGYGRSHTDTLSQSLTIPSGCSTYTLSFWLHIDTAERTTTTAYDKLTVSLGSTTLATYSNLNKAAGYAQHSFNVSGLAGQTVTLTFKGVEDSSLQTSFVVDDTALNVS
jgi:subtilase family serine protease